MHLSPGISLSSASLCLVFLQFFAWYFGFMFKLPLILKASFSRDTDCSSLLLYIHSLTRASLMPIHKPGSPLPPSSRIIPQVDTTTRPDSTSLPARSDAPYPHTSLSYFLGSPKISSRMCRPISSWPAGQFLGWRCSENQCFDYV